MNQSINRGLFMEVFTLINTFLKYQGLYHLVQKAHSIKTTLKCIRISQNMSHFWLSITLLE